VIAYTIWRISRKRDSVADSESRISSPQRQVASTLQTMKHSNVMGRPQDQVRSMRRPRANRNSRQSGLAKRKGAPIWDALRLSSVTYYFICGHQR
jgi:hypothetical protein